MKAQLIKVFSPILNLFESGDGSYQYKRSFRIILMIVGALFLLLSIASLAAALSAMQLGALIPFVVFFLVGSLCEIVAFLGSDRAVAKIWGK